MGIAAGRTDLGGARPRGGRGRRLLAAALALFVAVALVWWLWNPWPTTQQRFDRGRNGLWVGHQWYTGERVRSEEPVPESELQRFAATLAEQRVRYAFVHVGPLLADGTTEDSAAPFFERLRERTPDTLYLAWLGGLVGRLDLHEPAFREATVETVERLAAEGFDGVHLNIEPLGDHEPGYVELLGALRARLPEGFRISQATRRAGPYGVAVGPLQPVVWSEDFYRATMALTDQTVLMAYDTKMDVAKHYVGFVKHQTELLVSWGCEVEGHQVLIGIPSYEDVPLYSNPEIENIENAAQGVRAALEERGRDATCFEGVAVYANWVTDAGEWDAYRSHWLDAESGFH